MKAILEIFLVAVAAFRAGGDDASDAPAGPPKFEPYAFTAFRQTSAYIDGPRLEAGITCDGGGVFDADGNLFRFDQALQGIRCVRADGRVITITGDNCFGRGGVNAASGPASALRLNSKFRGYEGGIGVAVRGNPLTAGKGELYVTEAISGARFKVWMDEKRGNRWWQERWRATDPAKLPRQTGQSADADGLVTLGGTLLKDGSEMLTTNDGFAYRLAGGKVACVLSPADYEGREVVVQGKKTIVKAWKDQGSLTYDELGDSFIIIGYGIMWRCWPAAKKLEHFVGMGGNEGRGPGLDGKQYGWDGPAWGAQFFCGPRGPLCHPAIPDLFFPYAADDFSLRRAWKGRVATLYPDGEWREHPQGEKSGSEPRPLWAFKNITFLKKDPSAFYVLVGREHNDMAVYRVTGVDFTKPTVGRIQEGK